MTCPTDLERARALTVGADPELHAHHATCAACRETWQQLVRAIELAREQPIAMPSAGDREQMRTAVLALAGERGRPAARSRDRLAIAGAVAAAAAVAVVAAWPGAGVAPRTAVAHRAHGTVHAATAALFEREAAAPDEIVRLRDGTIDVAVTPLGAGERFRVIVGTSEVEVRGTAFTVSAAADRLVAVAVVHGRVEVRPADSAATVLEAGQSWGAPDIAVAPPVHDGAAPPIARPTRAIPPTVAAQVRAGSTGIERAQPRSAPDQLAYDAAWDALRAGKFHDAAAAFARSCALAPDGPLAKDARYWHAVALAREPRAADAITAFRELVDEDAGNPHRGEASAMLGWLLVDAHQLDEAAQRFRVAADDPRTDVRTSAHAGLAALGR